MCGSRNIFVLLSCYWGDKYCLCPESGNCPHLGSTNILLPVENQSVEDFVHYSVAVIFFNCSMFLLFGIYLSNFCVPPPFLNDWFKKCWSPACNSGVYLCSVLRNSTFHSLHIIINVPHRNTDLYMSKLIFMPIQACVHHSVWMYEYWECNAIMKCIFWIFEL